jgi:hypothetical protein
MAGLLSLGMGDSIIIADVEESVKGGIEKTKATGVSRRLVDHS